MLELGPFTVDAFDGGGAQADLIQHLGPDIELYAMGQLAAVGRASA